MLPQPQKGSAMMIHVTQLNKLSFNVQFDPAMTDALNEASGWSTPERALHSILADALLGPSLPQGYLDDLDRSEEHTSELQSLMRISYAVFCLKIKTTNKKKDIT